MKKLAILVVVLLLGGSCLWAQEVPAAQKSSQQVTDTQRKKVFQARRKQIKKLVKKYKKANEADKPALYAELEKLVSLQMDDGLAYMQERLAEEQARLDRWKAHLKTRTENVQQTKEKWISDLLTGAAKQKHKKAKKAWKKQLQQMRKRWY